MDLNYIYHRHQISLILAERAACERSRSAHSEMARSYAILIEGARSAPGPAARS